MSRVARITSGHAHVSGDTADSTHYVSSPFSSYDNDVWPYQGICDYSVVDPIPVPYHHVQQDSNVNYWDNALEKPVSSTGVVGAATNVVGATGTSLVGATSAPGPDHQAVMAAHHRAMLAQRSAQGSRNFFCNQLVHGLRAADRCCRKELHRGVVIFCNHMVCVRQSDAGAKKCTGESYFFCKNCSRHWLRSTDRCWRKELLHKEKRSILIS